MKKAIMYGAGNIGRGFIGQVFSESGYEVVFIDVNHVVIDRLNADGEYPVTIAADGGYRDEMVHHVRGVNSAKNPEQVAEEIATADIMATAVGVKILPYIAEPIARGLKLRWQRGEEKPLNIIICENMLDADRYMEKLLKEQLTEEEKGLFEQRVGLVEASIGRMVPVMPVEMQQGNPLRVCVEPYRELPVDRNAFKGGIPDIKGMVPFAPFSFYIQRKLFMHNMGHATTAYLGYLKGCKTIWEACRIPTVKLAALRALQESALAMSAEHGVPLEKLLDHVDDLVYRFGNRLLGDTVERVGKDPVRKLSPHDRLTGAMNLCIKQGAKPVYIAVGMAAAFVFSPESDEAAAQVRKMVTEQGIRAALSEYCGITAEHPMIDTVEAFYQMLESGKPIEEVLERAEKLKRG